MKSQSAGGIVFNKRGEVLLVVQLGNSISFPKGRINSDEDHEVAARREIAEESGITQLTLVSDLGTYERPNMFVPDEIKQMHMFLYTTDQEELRPSDPDNPEAMWVRVEEVSAKLSSPVDGKFFDEVVMKVGEVSELLGEKTRR